ncbi:hypothetical protein NJI34_00315 [Pseudomonas sp. S 311-6]|uniref:hypothetical protein n=1 Tax=Pseudomonas TaxID=286 RepID=UPI0020977FD0|nr:MULTISPECIES: hypothetical protein [Pseudomonas]MCO7563570.1 hypothetical protein [Pseudomonas mosselii]MCO7616235.1 hypothetical protein [Pseudomonas guariconensis]MCO7635226.1 hypothetical protein [Pseudomonas sp. S 311-6]
MTDILQPSFSAGELAPATQARADLTRYFTGLKTCRNFMVMPEGGARNRSGYRFLAETKISSRKSRLIPFQFSTEQTYAIEFGHLYVRFYTNGGQLLDGASVYEVATPYQEQHLFELCFTQSADVLTIAHPSYEPRELKRLGATNWTLTTISFMPSIAAPTGLTATPLTGGSGDTTTFRYVVTAVAAGETAEESVPSAPATVAAWDNKSGANLSWSGVSGADHYNVYKENNGSGVFGFIGMATNTAFTDLNITAEKNDTPPSYQNPFADGNNPGVVGYYQQRLVFAASESKPQTIWMSRVGAFNNFGYSQPRKDDDAIELTIASNQVNRIRSLVPLKELLVLTSGAEVTISGDATGIKPTNVRAIFQSYIGSSPVPPAVYGNTALYVQARGQKLADLAYSYTSDGFQGQDLTVLSSHLVRGYEITAMALAQVPNSVLWCVRNDGVKLGFTYLPAQEVFSWHRHDTDGAFESIVSIPEGDEDAVYAIVRRTINGATKRYVERLASRELRRFGSGEYWFDRAFFVDSGLTYDGRRSGTAVLTGGTDWKYPSPLTLTVGTSTFNAGMVGRSVILYGGGTPSRIGDLLTVKILAYTSPTVVTVEPQTVVPASLRGISATRWGLAATMISGLDHLEGKTVSILADGNVAPQQVVSSGAIQLDGPSLVVHAGLPIVADFETLDVALPNNPAFLGNRKRTNELTVFCEESRGFWAGSDADHLRLYEYKQRSTENYGEPIELLTGRAPMKIPSPWGDFGRVFIRQLDPLPLSILGVMTNVQAGG